MDKSSGVGVVDKTVAVLEALAWSPCSLSELVTATGLPRPTAHRLATALEHHQVVARDELGRFVLGPRLAQWTEPEPWRGAHEAVEQLRDACGESAQVFRRVGDDRLCVAAAEPPSGLRDTVPVGARLSMRAGSGAQVLAAWAPDAERARLCRGAAFSERDLSRVREQGWAHSVSEREPGVASLAAPVRNADGDVIAAIGISGPAERLASPSRRQVRTVISIAAALSQVGWV